MRWIKEDGREIETNDLPATKEAAIRAGWKEVKPKPKAKAKRTKTCQKKREI